MFDVKKFHPLFLCASLGPLGHVPYAPGTVASAATCLVAWYGLPFISAQTLFIGLVALFFIGRYASFYVEKETGIIDPSWVVIDEMWGMLISLYMVPHTWNFFLLAFLIFRYFDITKPGKIKKLEKISNGYGIMLDDGIAGVYTRVGIFFLELLKNST